MKDNFTIEDFIEHGKSNDYDLNYDGLLELISKHNVNLKFCKFKLNVVGLATFDGIFINSKLIDRVDVLYYAIIHEIAHKLRIIDLGFDAYSNNILKLDFESYFKHIVEEEIIADRYACIIGSILNKEHKSFNKYNQGLESSMRQEIYKPRLKELYDSIPNTYEEYVKFLYESIVSID